MNAMAPLAHRWLVRGMRGAAGVSLAALLAASGSVVPSAHAAPNALPAGFEVVETRETVNILPGNSVVKRSECPGGKQVIGGGARLRLVNGDSPGANTTLRLMQNGPDTPRSWLGNYLNVGQSAAQVVYDVFAICITPNPGYQLVSEPSPTVLGAQSGISVPVLCPNGTRVVSGGVTQSAPASGFPSFAIYDSGPHTDRTWTVGFLNPGNAAVNLSFAVWAICVTREAEPAGYTLVSGSTRLVAVPPGTSDPFPFGCPTGTRVFGGGFTVVDVLPSTAVPRIAQESNSPLDASTWVSWLANFGATSVDVERRLGVICGS